MSNLSELLSINMNNRIRRLDDLIERDPSMKIESDTSSNIMYNLKNSRLTAQYKYTNEFLNEAKYGDIFRDKNLYFHGIKSYDFRKLMLIMKYGIIPTDEMKKHNIEIDRTSPNGHNGDNAVSISCSPGIYNDGASSFRKYSLGKISFILNLNHKNDDLYYARRENTHGGLLESIGMESDDNSRSQVAIWSEYKDERFKYGGVDKDKIMGIMIPGDKVNEMIDGKTYIEKIKSIIPKNRPIYDSRNGFLISS